MRVIRSKGVAYPASYTDKQTTPTETQEAIVLADWLRLKRIFFCHIPNEGKRSVVHGATLKRCGMEPGAPDYLIFDRPPEFPGVPGVAIELKRLKGGGSVVRDTQVAFIKKLEEKGWMCKIAFGADEAIEWLTSLGYGEVGFKFL